MTPLIPRNDLESISAGRQETGHDQAVPLFPIEWLVYRNETLVAQQLNIHDSASDFSTPVARITNSRCLQNVIRIGHGVFEQFPQVMSLNLHHVHSVVERQSCH